MLPLKKSKEYLDYAVLVFFSLMELQHKIPILSETVLAEQY